MGLLHIHLHEYLDASVRFIARGLRKCAYGLFLYGDDGRVFSCCSLASY
jgi:hypothetical protein